MKDQLAEVRAECTYIALSVSILSLLMQAVFLIAGYWDYTVLLGNLFGAAVAIGNFLWLAVTVTRAIGKEEKEAAEILRTSRTVRTFLQFLLAVIGALIPVFHILAVLLPLLFPRVAIALYPIVLRRRAASADSKKEGQDD
ncbi:MAG: hypothetical protein J6T24_00340 [Clostridia bacterium]|nr:hypothetical protein [Clostridia bacterium]